MDIKKRIGQRLANFSSQCYNDGIRGQCVWYVRGRAKEAMGVDTGIRGNAKEWYSQAQHKGYEPKSNSIACFNGGSYGHVVYVELVENGLVYYTEANAAGTNKNGSVYPADGVLKTQSLSGFKSRRGYQGCIYITDYKTAKTQPGASGTQTVTACNLNYRKSPDGEIAGTLPKGTPVKFADNTTTTAGGYVWRKILVNNKVFYAAQKYLTK